MSKQKAIIVSGYFNPINKGYLAYFNNAKTITDKLFVIANTLIDVVLIDRLGNKTQSSSWLLKK